MHSPATPPIQWPAEAIWQAVAPSWPGFTVEILPQIDSSNSELMRRFKAAADGQPSLEPTLLIAEQQTAGRGRLGRSWTSRKGDSLTFSLGLPLQRADWSGLSLVVGISLADSLDPGLGEPARIGLKWPNDLWLTGPQGEGKLAGILVETASWEGHRCAVIGVGINIHRIELPAQAEVSAGPIATACLHDLHPELHAAAALLRVVPPLVQALQQFERSGFAPFQSRFDRRDVLLGRAVQLSGSGQHAGVHDGIARGVSQSGALLVQTPSGVLEITSSEVTLRPTLPRDGQAPC